jgi:hypothetical protein
LHSDKEILSGPQTAGAHRFSGPEFQIIIPNRGKWERLAAVFCVRRRPGFRRRVKSVNLHTVIIGIEISPISQLFGGSTPKYSGCWRTKNIFGSSKNHVKAVLQNIKVNLKLNFELSARI